MSLTKAQISSVLINFSLSDYDARMVDDKGSVVFNVAEHKTSSTHGAATICVNAEEARLLSSYLNMSHAVLQNFNSPFFFVSHTGKQMKQSTVASALSTAFGNIRIKDRVSCTKVWKFAVTAVHSKHTEQKHNVAVHMKHRTATAEKYYCFVEKHTNSIRCTELLQQSMQHLDQLHFIVHMSQMLKLGSSAVELPVENDDILTQKPKTAKLGLIIISERLIDLFQQLSNLTVLIQWTSNAVELRAL